MLVYVPQNIRVYVCLQAHTELENQITDILYGLMNFAVDAASPCHSFAAMHFLKPPVRVGSHMSVMEYAPE